MHHVKRLSLVAVALIGAGLLACEKESKDAKQQETKEQPPAKPEGEGAGLGLGKPGAAQLAMSGFLGAAKQAPNQPAKAGGGGLSGLFGGGLGGGGGLGAAMGGMLGGGGGGTAARAPDQEKPIAVDVGEGDQPPETGSSNNPFPPGMKLPPGGKAGGDCGAVADRLMVIVTALIDEQMKAQVATMTPEAQQMTKAYLEQYLASGELKKQMADMCQSQSWSQQLRDCVLVAATVDDMMKCEQFAPAGMKGGGGDPDDFTDDVAAPEAQAPAWGGGNSCEDVGKRMQQLYTLSMGDQSQWPAETKKQVADQLAAANVQLVQACKDASFSDAVRSCLVKANTLEATQPCWQLMATP